MAFWKSFSFKSKEDEFLERWKNDKSGYFEAIDSNNDGGNEPENDVRSKVLGVHDHAGPVAKAFLLRPQPAALDDEPEQVEKLLDEFSKLEVPGAAFLSENLGRIGLEKMKEPVVEYFEAVSKLFPKEGKTESEEVPPEPPLEPPPKEKEEEVRAVVDAGELSSWAQASGVSPEDLQRSLMHAQQAALKLKVDYPHLEISPGLPPPIPDSRPPSGEEKAGDLAVEEAAPPLHVPHPSPPEAHHPPPPGDIPGPSPLSEPTETRSGETKPEDKVIIQPAEPIKPDSTDPSISKPVNEGSDAVGVSPSKPESAPPPPLTPLVIPSTEEPSTASDSGTPNDPDQPQSPLDFVAGAAQNVSSFFQSIFGPKPFESSENFVKHWEAEEVEKLSELDSDSSKFQDLILDVFKESRHSTSPFWNQVNKESLLNEPELVRDTLSDLSKKNVPTANYLFHGIEKFGIEKVLSPTLTFFDKIVLFVPKSTVPVPVDSPIKETTTPNPEPVEDKNASLSPPNESLVAPLSALSPVTFTEPGLPPPPISLPETEPIAPAVASVAEANVPQPSTLEIGDSPPPVLTLEVNTPTIPPLTVPPPASATDSDLPPPIPTVSDTVPPGAAKEVDIPPPIPTPSDSDIFPPQVSFTQESLPPAIPLEIDIAPPPASSDVLVAPADIVPPPVTSVEGEIPPPLPVASEIDVAPPPGVPREVDIPPVIPPVIPPPAEFEFVPPPVTAVEGDIPPPPPVASEIDVAPLPVEPKDVDVSPAIPPPTIPPPSEVEFVPPPVTAVEGDIPPPPPVASEIDGAPPVVPKEVDVPPAILPSGVETFPPSVSAADSFAPSPPVVDIVPPPVTAVEGDILPLPPLASEVGGLSSQEAKEVEIPPPIPSLPPGESIVIPSPAPLEDVHVPPHIPPLSEDKEVGPPPFPVTEVSPPSLPLPLLSKEPGIAPPPLVTPALIPISPVEAKVLDEKLSSTPEPSLHDSKEPTVPPEPSLPPPSIKVVDVADQVKHEKFDKPISDSPTPSTPKLRKPKRGFFCCFAPVAT